MIRVPNNSAAWCQRPARSLDYRQANRDQGPADFAQTAMRGLFAAPLPRQVADLSVVILAGFLWAPHQAEMMISSTEHGATQLAASQAVRKMRTADPPAVVASGGPDSPFAPCGPAGPASPAARADQEDLEDLSPFAPGAGCPHPASITAIAHIETRPQILMTTSLSAEPSSPPSLSLARRHTAFCTSRHDQKVTRPICTTSRRPSTLRAVHVQHVHVQHVLAKWQNPESEAQEKARREAGGVTAQRDFTCRTKCRCLFAPWTGRGSTRDSRHRLSKLTGGGQPRAAHPTPADARTTAGAFVRLGAPDCISSHY
jgi:hypothetical protein